MTTLSKTFRTALSALVLAVASLATAPRVLAQEPVAKATIPFDFQYGSAHLRAGQYTVNMTTHDILQLRGRPQSAFAMVQWTDDRQPSRTGKLIFHRYGDHYILKEVWLSNESTHARCPKPRNERQLEELGQNNAAAPNVEVALLETSR